MPTFRKAVLIVLVLCLCVGCDQATKAVARDRLAQSQPVYLMGDLLLLQYSENTGAFLSLGASLPSRVRFWLLMVLVGVVLLGMMGFVWTYRGLDPVGVVAGSLVVGGGLSNLIDRIYNAGKVSDFVNVGIGNLRTGIFNLADLAIVVGVGILLISGVLRGETHDEGT
jgi:signal peptidase II